MQRYLTNRNVRSLFHFTAVNNVPGILNYGIRPSNLVPPGTLINDHQRLDRTNAACLTISFPNYKYFYSLRNRLGNENKSWAVIEICSSLLWEEDCIFCTTNAAAALVTSIPLQNRRGLPALAAMFDDFQDIKRASLRIPPQYPTNPQAEVLVINGVPANKILRIWFNTPGPLEYFNINYQQHTFKFGNQYFIPRMDYLNWKKNG